jgi:hypothetical protein
MAADTGGEKSVSAANQRRLQRIQYLSTAATAAREDGNEEVAETNLREALSEVHEFRDDIKPKLRDVKNPSTGDERLKTIVNKLDELEENIQKQLKLL